MSVESNEHPQKISLSVPELVAMMAALMALNALAIDIMLPALPHMGRELSVSDPNHRQYVITAYLLGLSFAQLFFGPASDRFGRRAPLLFSIAGYALLALVCMLAPSFTLLVVARALQGVFASGARVISMSIVRDAYEGRGMARIMSFVSMVFMVVPILAPGIGQLVLFVAPWRGIFAVLVVFSLSLMVWVLRRLPETLAEADRKPIDPKATVAMYWRVVRTRVTLGYTIASGLIFSGLIAYISSAEQVFSEVFDRGSTFTLYFAGVASAMALASLLNARLVPHYGMRRLSRLGLIAIVLANGAQLGCLYLGAATFITFYGALLVTWFCFSFIGANFNALAMQPLGDVAGTGSAFIGFSSTLLATLLGGIIGQAFDGTVLPLTVGFAAAGALSLLIVQVTDRKEPAVISSKRVPPTEVRSAR